MRTCLSAAIAFVACGLVAVPAAADDAPYAPKEFTPDELIVTEQFDDVPLSFPWDRVSSQRTPVGTRMDFELIYDVDYDTVYDTIDEATSKSEDFVRLEPDVLRYTDVDKIRVAGHQMSDQKSRVTLGHPDLEPTFTVEIEPDGNRTRIVVHNMMRTRQFSGFVPARVDFQPVGANPIPFRWN